MKKLVPFLLLSVFFTACGSNTTKSEADTKGGTSTSAVENVNGNVPDTTNTVPLNNKPLPKDSSNLKDSAAKH